MAAINETGPVCNLKMVFLMDAGDSLKVTMSPSPSLPPEGRKNPF